MGSGGGGMEEKRGTMTTSDGRRGGKEEDGEEVGDGFNVARAFLHGRGPNRVRADGPRLGPSVKRGREREREKGLWRRRWPRADAARGKKNVSKGASSSRTINHRGNSIDGCWLLQGASDACQTRLVPRLPNNLRKDGVILPFEPSTSFCICVILHA